ncbi:MAG: bacteriohemerythrin [bacterium]|nr:bacteriohemerythrin [bacterium]
MKKMEWGPALETGIQEVDTQHKRIVNLVNQMQEARLNKDMETVASVITEMVDYTLSHFAFEEALMEEAGYRFLVPHRRVHELFAMKIPEFQARFEAGEDITEELHTMLVRWLYNHIRGDDQGYVESVQKFLHKNIVPSYEDHTQHAAVQEIQVHRPQGFFARLKHAFFSNRNHI